MPIRAPASFSLGVYVKLVCPEMLNSNLVQLYLSIVTFDQDPGVKVRGTPSCTGPEKDSPAPGFIFPAKSELGLGAREVCAEFPEAGLIGTNKLPNSTKIAISGLAFFPMPLAYKMSGPKGRAQLFFQRKFGLSQITDGGRFLNCRQKKGGGLMRYQRTSGREAKLLRKLG